MPQSLARLYVHLVFSTKNRQGFLCDTVRPSLHAYQARVLQNLNCTPILINSLGDHTHLLFDMARTVTLSQIVKDVKQSSSVWIKTQGIEFRDFAWQTGYGAFSVSESQVDIVQAYIQSQEDHHSHLSFQDELRALLEEHRIAFDEKYLWD